MMNKPDDESTLEGIQNAITAYKTAGGNIRELIGFITREALSCQLHAAFTGKDPEALSFFVTINTKITELFEEILLSGEHETPPEVIEQLKREAQGMPWWPVRYRKGGYSRGEALVSKLDVGSKFPLKQGAWSMQTPWIRLCIRLFFEVNNLSIRIYHESRGIKKSPYESSFYSPLASAEKHELLTILGRSGPIGPLSKETASQWVNKIYIPYLLLQDPTLEMTPEAASILNSTKVKEHGAKQEVFRSELSKHLVPAIKRLL